MKLATTTLRFLGISIAAILAAPALIAASGLTPQTDDPPPDSAVSTDPADETIYTAADEMPEFPGGETALYRFIASNIRYPKIAIDNNIQGRIVVQFVVTKTGEVGQAKILRGKHPVLDQEAVRLVKSLPGFIPAKMDGNPVNVWYTLPINFRLNTSR